MNNEAGYSFPLTAADWTGGEWAAVVAFGLTVLFMGSCMVYIIANRHYRPLKAIQIPLVCTSFVASWMFGIGLLQTSRIIPNVGTFGVCTFWSTFVYMTFGMHLVMAVLVFRFLRLYRILNQRKKASGWRFMLLLPAILVPSLVISTAVAIASEGYYYFPEENTGVPICYSSNGAFYSNMLYLLLEGIVFIALSVKLRRHRYRIFHEYGPTVMMFVLLVVVVIIYAIIVLMQWHYYPWGRTIQVFLPLIALNYYAWVLISRPMIGAIFYRDRHLQEFNDSVRGKVVSDDVPSTSSNGGTSPSARRIGVQRTDDDLSQSRIEGDVELGIAKAAAKEDAATVPSTDVVAGAKDADDKLMDDFLSHRQ